MWKGIYIGLLISLFTATTSYSQNWQQTLKFAELALEREDYQTALLTFQRLAFFSKGQENKAYINFQIARCYHLQGKFKWAARYYDQCFYLAEDSLAQQALVGKIGLLLSQSMFKEALAEIYALEYSAVFKDTQRLAFLEGLAHFGNLEYEKAHDAFSKALPADDTLSKNQLRSLLLQDKRLSQPNPQIARTISFILPGAGQLYAGDLKNGLNSMALNAALVALAVNVATTYSLLDAGLVVLPWWLRYYLGGAEKARLIAERKRLENRAALYHDVLDIFQERSLKK